MAWRDLKVYLNSFKKEVDEWEKRFQEDKDNRWLVNYIFMREKIKSAAQNHLSPLTEELERIKTTYAEEFQQKDLPYHVDSARHYVTYMKDLLKELHHMYKTEAPYEHIRGRWEHALPSLQRRSGDLLRRIQIIEKILAGKQEEETIKPYEEEVPESITEQAPVKKGFWKVMKERMFKPE